MAFNLRRLIPQRWLKQPAALSDSVLPSAWPQPFSPPQPSPSREPWAPLAWRGSRWSPELLASMDGQQFQALCKALFAPTGIAAQTQPREQGGALDIRLYSQRERTPLTLVRCVQHQGSPVDVAELRQFLQDIAAQRLSHGTFATSSTFTPQALDFASDSGFSALDGGSLLTMIERRTPQQQRALMAVACSPDGP